MFGKILQSVLVIVVLSSVVAVYADSDTLVYCSCGKDSNGSKWYINGDKDMVDETCHSNKDINPENHIGCCSGVADTSTPGCWEITQTIGLACVSNSSAVGGKACMTAPAKGYYEVKV